MARMTMLMRAHILDLLKASIEVLPPAEDGTRRHRYRDGASDKSILAQACADSGANPDDHHWRAVAYMRKEIYGQAYEPEPEPDLPPGERIDAMARALADLAQEARDARAANRRLAEAFNRLSAKLGEPLVQLQEERDGA